MKRDSIGKLVIVSCGVSLDGLSGKALSCIDNADIIAGGRRLLEWFPDFRSEKIVIGGNITAMVDSILEKSLTKKMVVLASGDALFNGIARCLTEKLPPDELEIIPNITAFQALMSGLALPWEKLSYFSVHGKKESLPWRRILNCELAVIYGDNSNSASDIASELARVYPSCACRGAVIGDTMGGAEEKISRGTLAELAGIAASPLSMLLLLPEHQMSLSPGIALGLPDSEFQHQNNMITHSETRAVVISKLRPSCGTMWDIGAGSGSVGIEVATLCRDLTVYSVESDAGRFEDVTANIKNFGIDNIEAVNLDACEAMEHLPAPDCVFIGGGGRDIVRILDKAFSVLKSGGSIVVSAITLETKALLSKTLSDSCKEVVSIAVSRSKNVSDYRMMKAENSIDLFVYRKGGLS